ADPQESGNPPVEAKAQVPEAKWTAHIVNRFIEEATRVLSREPDGNTVLLRGFALHPDLPSFYQKYKLEAAGIAVYPMYRGIARLVGMEILPTGESIEEEVETLKENFEKYSFFFLHIKKTDSYGEDGNIDKKRKVIENVDKVLPMITELGFDVICVTGDHSTPALFKAHSWHDVPVLINGKYAFPDDGRRFTERECIKGILGHFKAKNLLTLLLANAHKLAKFGA
ncbi:MAG: phosphoglycerate mutase, partial [Candidatus Aenigmatarchaeota archaeon]